MGGVFDFCNEWEGKEMNDMNASGGNILKMAMGGHVSRACKEMKYFVSRQTSKARNEGKKSTSTESQINGCQSNAMRGTKKSNVA
jgi:hypothetical protein